MTVVVGAEIAVCAVAGGAATESAAPDDAGFTPIPHDDSARGYVRPDDASSGSASPDDAWVAPGDPRFAPDDDTGFAAAEVRDAQRALALLARRVASGPEVGGTRAEWATIVTACQSLTNTATAVQDVAITRLAAIEEEWLEDGMTTETRRAPGHIALDAPDIVAGALGVSHVHAQRRVGLAVRLVAGSDADADSDLGEQSALSATGLSALHAAMVDGDLDAYRAGVVVEELTEAPPEVADAVVGVLLPYLDIDTAVQLRQRCRRALARISPDLLRQRAKRAREACSLRRWVDEPGVDRWDGTFPSEQAAEGWAAVDALARRYVAEGRCQRVDAARAQALMDLIRAQATIDVQLVVTVPASSAQQHTRPAEPSERSESLGQSERSESSERSEPLGQSERSELPEPPELSQSRETPEPLGSRAPKSGAPQPGASPRAKGSSARWSGASAGPPPPPPPGPGGSAFVHSPTATQSPRTGPRSAPERVAPSAVRSWPASAAASSAGPPASAGDAQRSDSVEDLVEVVGLVPGEPVLVRGGWVRSLHLDSAGSALCHPCSGALLDRTTTGTTSYRPNARLAALVRARDGRCRFPGCSVAARFCDLDHVLPWPTGPTTAANLMCLCRRHHRIKQGPGWSVRLRPDARAAWSDPTGRSRTSHPRDLLDLVVLPAPPDLPERVGQGPSSGGTVDTTSLEVLLAVLGDHGPPRPDGGRSSSREGRVHWVPPRRDRRVRYLDDRLGHTRRRRRHVADPGVTATGPF